MAAAADSPRPAGRGVALALGGGAARGWAHLGVLRVLQERSVPVAAVAGTSIGALAAACFAADRLDLLETIARTATWRRVLTYLDPHLRRGAVLGGRRIRRELELHFGDQPFEALAVPTAVVAADLDSGAEVRVASGPIAPAVEASMAIPGLFRPVSIGGRSLIDGGIVANLPIGAARMLAPGRPVVAIDLMGDYAGHVRATRPGGRERAAIATVRSAFLMMVWRQTQQALAIDPPELIVRLPVGHISTGAFTRADDLIALGREAALAALPEILTLAAA